MPQPWHLLAQDPAAAEAHALRELAADPAASLLLGAARRRLGDLVDARETLAPLVNAATAGAPEWFEWGMLLAALGEDSDAIAALEKAVARAPHFASAWWALGDLHAAMGEGVAAGQAYARAARAGTTNPALITAADAIAGGAPQAAEALLQAHLRTNQADGLALRLLAEAVMRDGRFTEAESMLAHLVAHAPGFHDARHSLAALLFAQRKFRNATPHFQKLLEISPYDPILRRLTALCCVESGDYASALPLIETLLRAAPRQPELWLRYAHTLKTLGQAAEAASAYRTCIELAPHWRAGAYLSLADMKTTRFTDGEIAAMRALIADPRTTQEDSARLNYALGAALEQREDYTGAFGAFTAGASARRRAIAYEPSALTDYVAAARAVFTPGFFAAHAEGGCTARDPIFVVGLPRAGSTLVEQILASHSDVEGAGELDELARIAADLRGGSPLASLPAILANLDPTTRTQLGTLYIEATRQHRTTGAPRFVDKMPGNALLVPLIALILPNATVIDVRRAPMAVGSAAFKQYFQPRQKAADFSYSLGEIARYIRDYTTLMSAIRAALPNGVHQVGYEELVTDTEPQIRALLAKCGLTFEPSCLSFWQTGRAVQTPSAQQVRQPIVTSGLEHWRNYEPYLGELRDGLGEV